jgi:hypothetical protein
MVQPARRGRPLDHPNTQITLLFSLPLPGLAPTVIAEAPASATSNSGWQEAARAALLAAAQQLLEGGARQVDVQTLAAHAGVSVVTVRAHWQYIAARLHLKAITQRRMVQLLNGSRRSYARAVLLCRGRVVARAVAERTMPPEVRSDETDQADNNSSVTRLICRVPLLIQGRGNAVCIIISRRRRRGWKAPPRPGGLITPLGELRPRVR